MYGHMNVKIIETFHLAEDMDKGHTVVIIAMKSGSLGS
jgi:hypothetical protein